jgi:hypothetical protein
MFDSFSYVTNDAAAIVVGTTVALWLIRNLRAGPSLSLPTAMGVSAVIGILVALTKITALAVVIPLALGVIITRVRWNRDLSRQWWIGLGTLVTTALMVQGAHMWLLEQRSVADAHSPFSLMLPKTPLNVVDTITIRLADIAAMVIGTGARTDDVRLDAGMVAPSALVLAFSLAAAAAFLLGIALPRRHFTQQPLLQPSGLGIGVLAGAGIVLLVMPAIWVVTGGYLTYVPIGRYLGPLVPLAVAVSVVTYQRFRGWAIATVIFGVVVAALGTVLL